MENSGFVCGEVRGKKGLFSHGAVVTLEGKVFQVGSHPEAEFEIDEREMDVAIREFAPIDNDLEHSTFTSFLGHPLGRLKKLWRQGKDVFGLVEAPRWLCELNGYRLGVSLAFDSRKRVCGSAITCQPRIGDAAVSAQFSRDSGQVGAAIDAAIKDGRALPYERNALLQLARSAGVGRFSTVVDAAIKEWLRDRPQHYWTAESGVALEVEKRVGMSEERKRELLSY